MRTRPLKIQLPGQTITTNTVILGLLTNNTIVGHYNLAEKIIGAISGLFAPITQAIYPHMSLLYKKRRFKNSRVGIS